MPWACSSWCRLPIYTKPAPAHNQRRGGGDQPRGRRPLVTAGRVLLVSLLLGLSSVSVQILIPLAAHLAPEALRGRTVGTIMAGLLSGILLSRPLSSVLAQYFGWRAVFYIAAAMTLVTVMIIVTTLPRRVPQHRATYAGLLASLWHLFTRYAVLRQRSLYQALLFAAFSLFWTAAPLELAGRYGLSQSQIGIFALVGALGAIAAPVAGRLADAGYTRIASYIAMIAAAVSFIPGIAGGAGGLYWLALTGIVLDFAVQMNMVLGQRAIYALDAASRGRLNALYMTAILPAARWDPRWPARSTRTSAGPASSPREVVLP